jgi:hypothetical protein
VKNTPLSLIKSQQQHQLPSSCRRKMKRHLCSIVTSSSVEARVVTPCFQVAEFVSEVDALHSELEALENSARVSFLVVFYLHVRVLVSPFFCELRCPVLFSHSSFNSKYLQELDTFSIQLEKAFRQAATKTK